MADSKQQKFIQGSAILIMSNFVIKGINFLLLPLYTSYLTPDMLGISDSVSNLTSILFPLLVMGLDSAFSAFYFDKREEDHYLKVYNTIRITLIISSLVPVLIALGSKQLSLILFKDDGYYVLVAISLISVSLNLWHLPFSLLARMRNRMGVFALVNTVSSLTMILLNILFLTKFHLGVYALVLSTAIVQLLQFILYELMLKERLNISRFDRELQKRMLKYSLPLIPNALAIWVLALSDRYIILHFCGADQVGLYGVAARFATAVSLVANGIYMSYTTFAFDKKGDSNDREYYSKILNAFVLAIMMICLTISMGSKEIIHIMAEAKYADTFYMIAPLLFSQLFYGINTLIGYAITFEKKSYYILIITSIGAVLNVVLNFIFIPRYGANAAAYTTLASYIVMVAATYYFAQKTFYVKYDTLKIVFASVTTLVASCLAVIMPLGVRIAVYIVLVLLVLKLFESSVRDYLNQLKKGIRRWI